MNSKEVSDVLTEANRMLEAVTRARVDAMRCHDDDRVRDLDRSIENIISAFNAIAGGFDGLVFFDGKRYQAVSRDEIRANLTASYNRYLEDLHRLVDAYCAFNGGKAGRSEVDAAENRCRESMEDLEFAVDLAEGRIVYDDRTGRIEVKEREFDGELVLV